eukprot:TRINITY_DN7717_c0_g1_i1.p1 TRINITY_DN7717_c0_g1~~TRINITY_DN7717_c0_g1_i1.p1  ORF type:complete len:639 (-),score=34.04 TRINITY_DN7717_c0_g1_i1:612-2528(-)
MEGRDDALQDDSSLCSGNVEPVESRAVEADAQGWSRSSSDMSDCLEIVPSGPGQQAEAMDLTSSRVSSKLSTSQILPTLLWSRSTSSIQVAPCGSLSPMSCIEEASNAPSSGFVRQKTSNSSEKEAMLKPLGEYEVCKDHVDRLTRMGSVETCRATSYMHVLRSFGQIFRHSEGNECTYQLSRCVHEIDAFISHNWSAPALSKFLVLCLHFNIRFATVCTFVSAAIICVATACGLLPVFDVQGAAEGHRTGVLAKVVCPIVFVCSLCGKHELYRCLGISGDRVFLDKICIHQTDPVLKRDGIESLPAFIERSTKIVVLYTNEYIQRLWTVYELATFLILFPDKRTVILPTGLPFFMLTCILAFMLQNLLTLLPVDDRLGIIRLAARQLPMLILGIYMRFRARSSHDMQRTVDTFSVMKAKCFCEDDRPIVNGNIVKYLRSSKMVDMTMRDDEVLKVFDAHVRRTFGQTIRQAIGAMGIRYRWLLVLVSVGLGAPNVDYIGALLHDCEDALEVAVTCIDILSWQFAGFPIHLASVAVVARLAVSARGVREMLIVLASLLAGCATTLGFYVLLSDTVLRPLAKESTVGLALFVLHHVLLLLLTWFIFCSYSWSDLCFWRRGTRQSTMKRPAFQFSTLSDT